MSERDGRKEFLYDDCEIAAASFSELITVVGWISEAAAERLHYRTKI